jgi:glycine betaine/choline ABC-type transport system substrate-binding protein
VVREAILKEYPELPAILAPLSDLLDDQTMRVLNWQVDGEKKSPLAVARDFLLSKNLLAANETVE